MSETSPLPLEEWTRQVVKALGLPEELSDAAVRTVVLDLARDVAHGVTRPAAPLTTFLAGVAAGRAGAGEAHLQTVAATVLGLLPGA